MTAQAETWTFEEKQKVQEKQKEGESSEEGSEKASEADNEGETAVEVKIHKMNAQLCMGENLADLGGMSLAIQALELEMNQNGWASTPEKRKSHLEVFFRSWANVWKCKQSDAYTVRALATDPHAPTSFRGNLVNNIDAFYEAFEVSPQDKMYIAPEKRVKMW